MPKTANPYLQRLSNILTSRLQTILWGELDKQRALDKAAETFKKHFRLVAAFSQRKTLPNGKKLSAQEIEENITIWVNQALTDFEKIWDDRAKLIQAP